MFPPKYLPTPPARPPQKRRKRRGFTSLFVFATTTAMIATGGFGAFPNNPLTETFQEVIGENFPEDFLQPFNSYMEVISAPTIPPQSDSNQGSEPPPDPFGALVDLFTGDPAPSTQMPDEATIVETAMVSIQQTQMQLATTTSLASPTLASTQTSIPTLTPNPSVTTSPVPTATIAWLLPTSTKPPPPPPTSTFTPTFTPTATPTFTPGPPCSTTLSGAIEVAFVNSSPTETVNVYWVDFACNLSLLGTYGPGQSSAGTTIATAIGHVFRYTNASTGQLLGIHTMSAPGTLDVWTGSFSITGDFSASSVSLNGGGSSIVVAPGQTVNVTYNFNIWDDPCPGCFTQLVTGLVTGTTGVHGGSCAFAGDAGLYPGASGSENVNLTAPLAPGIYYVTASYQWQFTCAQALTAYAGGTTGRLIGQIEVSYTAAGPANISGELWYYGQPGFSCVDVCTAHGGINTTAFDKVGGITGTNAYCDLVFDTLLGPGTVADWAGIGNGLGCMYDIAGFRVRYIDAVNPAASSGNAQRICACNN